MVVLYGRLSVDATIHRKYVLDGGDPYQTESPAALHDKHILFEQKDCVKYRSSEQKTAHLNRQTVIEVELPTRKRTAHRAIQWKTTC